MSHIVCSSSAQSSVVDIFLNRPEKCNALNYSMLEELLVCLQKLSICREQLICIRAKGDVFCAGLDLKQVAGYCADGDRVRLRSLNQLVGRVLEALRALNNWVVVMVEKPVYGGGIGLLAAADYVVMVPSVTLHLSELRIGLIPGQIYPYLYEKIGPCAQNLLVMSKTLDAKKAFQVGLVQMITDSYDDYIKTLTEVHLKGHCVFKSLAQTMLPSIELQEWQQRAANSFADQAMVAYESGYFANYSS